MSRSNSRLAAALVIVAVIVLSAPLLDGAFHATGVVVDGAAEHEALSAVGLSGEGGADAVLSRLAVIADNTTTAPAWFDEEVGVLPGARDVRVDDAVVGYVVDKEEAKAFRELKALMESGGWTSVPLVGVTGATFVKDAGECTWALVTCTQVGSATSVVIRVM